jgi:hypothetical protein
MLFAVALYAWGREACCAWPLAVACATRHRALRRCLQVATARPWGEDDADDADELVAAQPLGANRNKRDLADFSQALLEDEGAMEEELVARSAGAANSKQKVAPHDRQATMQERLTRRRNQRSGLSTAVEMLQILRGIGGGEPTPGDIFMLVQVSGRDSAWLLLAFHCFSSYQKCNLCVAGSFWWVAATGFE